VGWRYRLVFDKTVFDPCFTVDEPLVAEAIFRKALMYQH